MPFLVGASRKENQIKIWKNIHLRWSLMLLLLFYLLLHSQDRTLEDREEGMTCTTETPANGIKRLSRRKKEPTAFLHLQLHSSAHNQGEGLFIFVFFWFEGRKDEEVGVRCSKRSKVFCPYGFK